MVWCSNFSFLLAQAAAKNADGDTLSIGLKLLLAVAIVVGSFALGPVVARMLKVPEFGTKIGVILFTLIASLSVCLMGWPPKRGIDLSGGVQLVYELNQQEVESNNLETAVNNLNSSFKFGEGTKKLAAKPGSNGTVEVFLAGIDAATAKEAIAKFPNSALNLDSVRESTDGGKPVLIYDLLRQAQTSVDMDKLVAAISKRVNPGGVKELTVRSHGEQVEVIIPEVDPQEVERIMETISKSGFLEFRILADQHVDRATIALAEQQSPATVIYKGATPVARWVGLLPDVGTQDCAVRESKSRGKEVLVLLDEENVTGKYLTHASVGMDVTEYIVQFKFNSEGGRLFGELTSANLPDEEGRFHRRLGIVLDGVLQSAPQINSVITTDGQITGHFTEKDVKVLVDVLNAGSLPAALRPDPISQEKISAELGEDTIRMGATSMVISTIAILVFMLVYYHFAGFVADTAVVLNILVTVALMIAVKAAFTLTGLAGLVLTVGMAVDANVLIYERMREESRHGSSLRMTIRNGFSRAMNTIIDSHCTTLTSGVVLFMIGTDQIKGFAVTLTIGLMLSLFTAIFVARVFFDIAEKKRWVTKLSMMHLIRETHIDFIGLQWPAISVSVLLIIVGMVAVAMRGVELFDIDFTGGSSVQAVFNDPQDIAEIRQTVTKLALKDVAVSSIGQDKRQFKIDTSNDNIKQVQEELKQGFGGKLKTYSMQFEELARIEPQKEAAPVEKPEGKPDGGKPETEEKGAATDTESKDHKATPPSNAAKPVESPAEGSPPPGKAVELPAEKKPAAETKPADSDSSEKPAKGDSSSIAPASSPAVAIRPDVLPHGKVRGDRPRSAEVASTGRVDMAVASLLLAQADDKAAVDKDATPDKPSADKPAEDKPATEKPEPASDPKSATEPATPAAEKSKSSDQESRPAEKSAAEDKANEDNTPAAKPENKAPDAGAMPRATTEGGNIMHVDDSYVGGTRANLKFSEPIKHSALEELVNVQLKKSGQEGLPFELSNPKFNVGSEAAYTEWTLEIKLPLEQTKSLLKPIQAELTQTPFFPSSSKIGGRVARDTQWIALKALLASMLVIVVYIWVRFQNVIFGVGAIVALVHDVLITVGFIALSSYLAPYFGFALVDPFKISLSVVAALLTIVGYSINDTIVVFDRIREVRGKSPDLTEQMINDSVNQTLSRTLLTSGTVFIGALILYLIGGPGIHAFAYAMLVGVIAGTYSSVYIASPVLLWMKKSPATNTRAADRAA